MGNNQRGITCLEALANSNHELVYAIAQRGEGGWYESIDKKAKELGIPSSIEEKPNNKRNIKRIRHLKPDLIVMCGYSKIIGKELLNIPRYGCINLHASLLPYYRGAAPLNWALINGEKTIGLSIYNVDEGIDTGPILAQERIAVSKEQTIKDVLDKTLEIYPRMLIDVCDKIESRKIHPRIQNPNEGSYYTKRHPRDGIFNWDSMTDWQIHNQIRALTHPYPGAFFYYSRDKIYVWRSQLEERNFHGIPGRIAAVDNEGAVVIAKNRGLRIKLVQKEGDKERKAEEIFSIGQDLVVR